MRVVSESGEYLYDSHMTHVVPSESLFFGSKEPWVGRTRAEVIERRVDRFLSAVERKSPPSVGLWGGIPRTDDGRDIYEVTVAWIDAGILSAQSLNPVGVLRMVDGTGRVSYHDWQSESLSGVVGGARRKEPMFSMRFGDRDYLIRAMRSAFGLPDWER